MGCFYVYILTTRKNTVLYVGVTNNVARRVYEHREGLAGGFTKRYSVTKLVYFEGHERPGDAIQRETNIKRWPRQWKIELIESINPGWRDLYEDLPL